MSGTLPGSEHLRQQFPPDATLVPHPSSIIILMEDLKHLTARGRRSWPVTAWSSGRLVIALCIFACLIPQITMGQPKDPEANAMLGKLRWSARENVYLIDQSDHLEYDVMHYLQDLDAPISLAELNTCGEWHDLAVRAVHHLIATEVQTSPPYFDVQCYRHTAGERTLVIHQSTGSGAGRSSSVFVYRISGDDGEEFDLSYAVRRIEDSEMPRFHMVVVNDKITGLVMTSMNSQRRVTIRSFSIDGEDSQSVPVRALFGMQKPGNQEFLAFEEDFPTGAGPGRAVFTRYGESILRIQTLPVEIVEEAKVGHVFGGTGLRIAIDRFRDALHGFWLHDWRIHYVSKLRGVDWSAGDDVVLSRLDLDPDSDGPGTPDSWPHDQKDSRSAVGDDLLGGCPVTFFVSPSMEVKQNPTRGSVVCSLGFGVEGWRIKMRQRETNNDYPVWSFYFRVFDSGFSEAVRSSEFSISVRKRRQARPTPFSTQLVPPFDHPSPDTVEDWCVPKVGGSGCGTEYVTGRNWSGFVSEGSKTYRSETGYGVVGATCRAVIEGPWGLSVVMYGVGGCAVVREVFETLRFPDAPIYASERYPGGRRPELVARVDELTLHDEPSRMYPATKITHESGSPVPFDQVRHITLHPVEIKARQPIEISCQGQKDLLRYGEVARYLQDAGNHTAVIRRRDGSICEVSLSSDPPLFVGLENAPVSEVWVRMTGAEGEPLGWLLVDNINVTPQG